MNIHLQMEKSQEMDILYGVMENSMLIILKSGWMEGYRELAWSDEGSYIDDWSRSKSHMSH